MQTVGWVSDVAFENVATIDGRYINKNALNWRDLPLTLMAMTVNSGEGHVGSFVAGRIDALLKDSSKNVKGEKFSNGEIALRGSGVFDMAGENGAEVARLVEDETLRGISVDMHPNEYSFRDPETGEVLEKDQMTDEQWEKALFGELQIAFLDATVVGATVCPTPAFDHAQIALLASAGQPLLRVTSTFEIVQPEPLTAAAVRKVPRSWFELPEAKLPTPLTVTDEGQVYGHAFLWNACHTGYSRCVTPPRSPSNYAYYLTGEVETLEGDKVTVGVIPMETGHASTDSRVSWLAAKSHYDHTGTVVADVTIRDGKLGGWVSGATRNISDDQRRELAACGKLSGDWRPINGRQEMIGLLAVNVAGFPIPKPQAVLAASADGDELLALVAAGQFETDLSTYSDQIELLAASAAENPIEALAELAQR